MITLARMKHSLAVAAKMKEIALKNPDKIQCKPEDAYTLGLIHDVGYAFASEQKEHAQKGGLILKEQGYKYWQEVYYHGTLQEEYYTPLLALLNYVDMTTGPTGEYMSMKERIDDIALRYGEESLQTIKAKELGNSLLNEEDMFN